MLCATCTFAAFHRNSACLLIPYGSKQYFSQDLMHTFTTCFWTAAEDNFHALVNDRSPALLNSRCCKKYLWQHDGKKKLASIIQYFTNTLLIVQHFFIIILNIADAIWKKGTLANSGGKHCSFYPVIMCMTAFQLIKLGISAGGRNQIINLVQTFFCSERSDMKQKARVLRRFSSSYMNIAV